MSPRKDGGERRALVIANGLYDDTTIRHLPAQQADAEKLAALLGDPSIGGFETETCVNKTSSEIRKAMGKLFHRRGREDLILVYYSGHGFKDDWGHLHLSSRDTDAELFASTCIDAAWLTRQIDCCAARKIVIILDCCYSGAYMSAPMLGEDLVDLHGAFSGDGSGRVVLSASSKVQLAYESVFTRYLVEGIETGAADSNGSPSRASR